MATIPGPESIAIAEIGSFPIGGRSVAIRGVSPRPAIAAGDDPQRIEPNGDFAVGQIYVQYVRLAAPRAPFPLLMWHGGGLTGASFETRPDGQPGWQWSFLRAGFDVSIVDGVGWGRASWARYPEIFPHEPVFRTKAALWELFRIGPPGSYASEPAARRPYADTRFPAAAFDRFFQQVVPSFPHTAAMMQEAYDALVRHVGPCVLLTHSRAGPFGIAAALHAPDLIKAHIAIEPSGGPDPTTVDITALRAVPHLVVWGDHLELERATGVWAGLYGATARFCDALAAAGGDTTWVDLPARGVRGNSHLLMMDDNAEEIADDIRKWLRERGLLR